MTQSNPTIKEAKLKLEHYCAYQERCHSEVAEKLRSLAMTAAESDEIIVHLINQNFLNEERFARAFARGKHRIKKWGRNRIVSELKQRNISQANINYALKEISPDEYQTSFDELSQRHWESISERNVMKKRKKFCDFMLRKGYESDMVYQKVKMLEEGLFG